jgi:hypothetical protein
VHRSGNTCLRAVPSDATVIFKNMEYFIGFDSQPGGHIRMLQSPYAIPFHEA